MRLAMEISKRDVNATNPSFRSSLAGRVLLLANSLETSAHD